MEIAIPYHRGSQGGIAAQLHITRWRKLCVILPIFTYPQSVARRHGFSVTGNPEKIQGWQQSRSIAEGEKGTGPVPTKSLQGLSHRPRRRNLTEYASLSACETNCLCGHLIKDEFKSGTLKALECRPEINLSVLDNATSILVVFLHESCSAGFTYIVFQKIPFCVIWDTVGLSIYLV